MIEFIWPLALVVLSNIFYHISAKYTPESLNPLASLTVTYLVGAVVSAILYFILNRNGNLIREYSKLNWAPFVLGVVIVGLEVGFIYAYKAGWQVSVASLVASTALSVVLVFVGYFLFKEQFTWNKIVGLVICLIGLVFINM